MIRECEYCPATESNPEILKQWNENKCPACIEADKLKESHIPVNEVLKQSREIDQKVQVKTDIFNAATVAIVDLKKSIDEDESIENKPYALAQELMTRFQHHKSVIFELQQKVVEASNTQKAIQVYLNQMANTLRQEEREKLKIADINYKPREMKLPVNRNTIRKAKKRVNKKELREYAAKLGVSEFSLQMLVVSKNLTAQEAYEKMKASIESASGK